MYYLADSVDIKLVFLGSWKLAVWGSLSLWKINSYSRKCRQVCDKTCTAPQGRGPPPNTRTEDQDGQHYLNEIRVKKKLHNTYITHQDWRIFSSSCQPWTYWVIWQIFRGYRTWRTLLNKNVFQEKTYLNQLSSSPLSFSLVICSFWMNCSNWIVGFREFKYLKYQQ